MSMLAVALISRTLELHGHLSRTVGRNFLERMEDCLIKHTEVRWTPIHSNTNEFAVNLRTSQSAGYCRTSLPPSLVHLRKDCCRLHTANRTSYALGTPTTTCFGCQRRIIPARNRVRCVKCHQFLHLTCIQAHEYACSGTHLANPGTSWTSE